MFWLYKKYANSEVYLWKITEEPNYFAARLGLSDIEWQALVHKYTNTQSLIHWLASRYLLKQVLGEDDYAQIALTESGKWYLPQSPDFHFSISHSEDVVAVAVSKVALGVDIQKETAERLFRISTKYIPASSIEKIRNGIHFVEFLHIHWGAKEAMFKAYSLGALDFKKNLQIPDFQYDTKGGSVECLLQKENQAPLNYFLQYEKIESYWLAVVTLSENSII